MKREKFITRIISRIIVINNNMRNIRYVGVNDRKIDLFEGQYAVPNGMAYNSYLVVDEKIAVMDSVEIGYADEWIEKIKISLNGRTPDYLVVQHMEPDHSSSIVKFAEAFPAATIVSSAKAFKMMGGFFGKDFAERRIVVGDGDSLSLGVHTLSFITAPMVHWPEVIMTYESSEGILFSADAFGRFGALDTDDDWTSEARRYYFGIIGKYGTQVQSVLKKICGFDIRTICPLHGPILGENLEYYLNLYNIWSSYEPEENGVCIAYATIYGNTRTAAELLAQELAEKGVKVSILDLARCDIHEAVENAFRYNRLVLAASTYNGGVFTPMREFINHLTERNYQNRRVAFIENGSWAPMATKTMKAMLEGSKNLAFAETEVKISSALSEESRAQIKLLARELA